MREKKKLIKSQKNKISLGYFKDQKDLNRFLKSKNFINKIFKITSLNLIKVLNVSYDRDYYIDTKNKLRITFDEKITTHQDFNEKFSKNYVDLSNNILEFKYLDEDSKYVREKIHDLNFNLRNQKFSKYVQSFIVLNEMGHI